MARGTSPTKRAAAKKSTTADETPATETAEEATVTTTAEAPVETTEPTESTENTENAGDENKTEDKPAEPDLSAFDAAVEAALAEADSDTGTVPEASLEAVKSAYRDLDGLKAKNLAKKALNDRLRDSVNAQDIVKAQGVMHLVDAVANAGTATKAAAERTPADPVDSFIQRLTVLNLAYNLVNGDEPDGKSEAEMAEIRESVSRKVGELTEQAEQYYAWATSTAEDKGDEPEVNPLVKKAVKMAFGKVGGSTRGPVTPHEGPRRNTARHIQLVFKDKPVGTFLKVAEIANTKSSEYPDKPVSAGAINARLKSNTPIEGIEPATDSDGKAGARKVAEVAGL
jgi:hypothetical protein